MKISGDFEMWVRMAYHYPVGFINKHLIQLRNHKEQLSRQQKYYIDNLKEDLHTYNILLNYVSNEQKKVGLNLLRNYKLLYYYTLMIKEFCKENIRTGWNFLKILNGFDNILFVSFYFLRNRLIL